MSAEEDSLIGRRVGKYVVDKKLGEGGMGAVYRLRHVEIPEAFQALKVLTVPTGGGRGAERGETVERFVQEARAAASVGSHRVIQIFDVGQFDDGTHYIVMEYVRGRSLAEVIKADGPLAVLDTLLLGCRIADTLTIAHHKGIIHRDVKPANLMLVTEGRDPQVKVLDFGVARATGETRLVETAERKIIGTPGYMAPEAAIGAVVDGRADVFSLAATLFEALTGQLPFGGDNWNQAMVNTITGHAPPVAAKRPTTLEPVSDVVENVIALGLTKDPERRPTMANYQAALVSAADAVASTHSDRGGPLMLSVLRGFAPPAVERPTLSGSAAEVSEILNRYGGRMEGKSEDPPSVGTMRSGSAVQSETSNMRTSIRVAGARDEFATRVIGPAEPMPERKLVGATGLVLIALTILAAGAVALLRGQSGQQLVAVDAKGSMKAPAVVLSPLPAAVPAAAPDAVAVPLGKKDASVPAAVAEPLSATRSPVNALANQKPARPSPVPSNYEEKPRHHHHPHGEGSRPPARAIDSDNELKDL